MISSHNIAPSNASHQSSFSSVFRRVLGSLQNFPEFAKAFNCNKSSYMVPDNVCRVWWSTDLSGMGRPPPSPYGTSPLWLLEHSRGGYGGNGSIPRPLYWVDCGWRTDTAVCTSSQDSRRLRPHRRTEHCPSDSDTVVHSISLITLLLTGFNHSSCFYFRSSCFLLSFMSPPMCICECVCECLSVKILCKQLAREGARQTNVLNPLVYEYTTHPLTLVYM